VELGVKRPGFEDKIETVRMDFSYHGVFAEPEHPDAYERVLVDAMKGDHTLFATSREVLEAWRILQPVLESWELNTSNLLLYEPNSNGPAIVEAHAGKTQQA
jgi:glucose-6-phosphate 1-dehydrogenase